MQTNKSARRRHPTNRRLYVAARTPIRLLKVSWPADRAGNSVLQFALVSIVLFTLVFGITDLARYFLAWQGLNTVASEAARASMVNNKWTFACANPTSGTAANVAAAAPFLSTSALTLCVTSSTSNGITTVSVTASYPFTFMIAPLSAANATLTAATQLAY